MTGTRANPKDAEGNEKRLLISPREGLEETFPASDPVNVTSRHPRKRTFTSSASASAAAGRPRHPG